MNFTPTDEQWEKMKRHIKSDKYSKEDFFVFETRAVGDRIVPHRYTKLMPDFLKVMRDDAQKGVSLMLNHNWSQLGVQSIPLGKVFDARLDGSSQEGETTSLYTTQYIHKDDSKIDGYSKNDIINLIETGVLADTSVGFTTDPTTCICSICGNSIYDFRHCEHIPGRKYIVDEDKNEVKQCIVEIHQPSEIAEEANNVLMENSLVFDGAYPNAVIQSKISDNKDKSLKALEGKQELSEKDVIIGYTSKEGVNLLYKHLEEGGEELAKKKLANEGDENLEETVQDVENVEESVEEPVEETSEEVAENVEENTEETTEEITEETSDVEETQEENEGNSDEEVSNEENLYTEADIISKFGNIADSFESLIQLAKEGLDNRNEVIEQALNSGVHSMGNAFNKEVFTKTFSSMSTKDIKEMAEAWENQAKMQFSDTKVSKSNLKNKEEDIEEISDYSKFKTANY